MLLAALCFLVVASSWAMYVPHDPSGEPLPINPLEPLWGNGFYKKAHHIVPLPVISGEHEYAPPGDDEHSDQKGHPPYIPEPPKMDNTRQSAQVINNYYVYAKSIDKFFDVEKGALPWSPPAKSPKRENLETHGKAPKLPAGVMPQKLPDLPPVVEVIPKQPNDILSILQSISKLNDWKYSELSGRPEPTGTATPIIEEFGKREKFGKDWKGSKVPEEVIPQKLPNLPPVVDITLKHRDDILSLLQSLSKSNRSKYSELRGGPEPTGTATPIIEEFGKREKFGKDWKGSKVPEEVIPQKLPNLPPVVDITLKHRDDILSILQSLSKLNDWKYSELSGRPETTGTATPITEDTVESLKGAQPSVNKSSVTETDEKGPPPLKESEE